MKNLPKLDLSKYKGVDRVPSKIVETITQFLIYYQGNSHKVAIQLNLDDIDVDKVFAQFYIQINKAIETKIVDDKMNKAIDTSVDMYNNHLSEIQNQLDSNNVKIIPMGTLKSVNSIMDRVIKMKDNNITMFDNCILELYNNIIRDKQLELAENGQPQDDTAYIENMDTLADKIRAIADANSVGRADPKGTMVQVTHITDGAIKIYPSIKACADEIGFGQKGISADLAESPVGKITKGEYIIEKINHNAKDMM